MSDTGDPDITRLLRDLTRELQRLQRELSTDAGPRPPSPGDLSRFTSEVAIPGVILVLETNIRVLQLLRRTIRMADGRASQNERSDSEVRARAEKLGRTTLAKLDDALAEVQSSLEERDDSDVDDLIAEARELQAEIRERLDATDPAEFEESDGIPGESDERDPAEVDVDAELRAIKNDIDEDDGASGGRDSDGAGGEDNE